MTIRVVRSEVTTDTQPTVQVYESTVSASTPQDTVAVRVYESTLATPVLPTVEAGLDQLNVEPGTVCVFTATSPDSPDTWTWRQVSGPTATFTQDAAKVTVTAPYTLHGGTVIMGVTCTKDGVTSVEDTVQVVALGATEWMADDTGWVPAKTLAVV